MSEFGFIKAPGWIEVIVGGMFSGKTEELIRRLRRADFARQKIQVFKPVIDQRYNVEDVTSHNLNSIKAIPIHKSEEIWAHLNNDTQTVGVDEGQFFDLELVNVAQTLADRGVRVIIAGLDTDWQARPFEPMPTLMAIAENVTKLHAVCVVCGVAASRTQRTGVMGKGSKDSPINNSKDRILVGALDSYEARCRDHFRPELVEPHLHAAHIKK